MQQPKATIQGSNPRQQLVALKQAQPVQAPGAASNTRIQQESKI
jgi:hypothetical protein